MTSIIYDFENNVISTITYYEKKKKYIYIYIYMHTSNIFLFSVLSVFETCFDFKNMKFQKKENADQNYIFLFFLIFFPKKCWCGH